jgi:hypothetical protein
VGVPDSVNAAFKQNFFPASETHAASYSYIAAFANLGTVDGCYNRFASNLFIPASGGVGNAGYAYAALPADPWSTPLNLTVTIDVALGLVTLSSFSNVLLQVPYSSFLPSSTLGVGPGVITMTDRSKVLFHSLTVSLGQRANVSFPSSCGCGTCTNDIDLANSST